MDKVLRLSSYSYCQHRVYKKLYATSLKPDAFLFSHTATVQNKRECSSNFPLWNFNMRNDLFRCNRRIPLHFHMCSFHLNSVQCKMNKRLIDIVKGKASGGDRLENKEWNIQFDPALDELKANLKKEAQRLSEETKVNDPELRKILSEIHQDFHVQESEDLNEKSSSKEAVKFVEAYPDSEKQAKEKHEEIEDFTYETDEEEEEIPQWVPPIELKRGVRGVFDIEDLVTVLKAERARDICVIQIPQHLQLADYMVIVSGISPRHCSAISGSIKAIYKKKKGPKDPFIKLDGKIPESRDWLAYDLGNIILHIFMPQTRELYDLETLWTVGEKYDDKSRDTEDPFTVTQSDLEWLQELEVSPVDKTTKRRT